MLVYQRVSVWYPHILMVDTWWLNPQVRDPQKKTIMLWVDSRIYNQAWKQSCNNDLQIQILVSNNHVSKIMYNRIVSKFLPVQQSTFFMV